MAKRLKLSSIFILALLVLGIFGYLYKEQVMTTITGWTTVEPEPTIATEEDLALYEKAVAENDELQCIKIGFVDFQQDCLVKAANAKKDINVCDMIAEKKARYGCYTDISKVTNDVSICEKVSDDDYWNDICYKNYAVTNNQMRYCWFIPEGIHNNPCFFDVAVKNNNYTVCKEITDKDKNTQCNYIIAKNLLSLEPCYQMIENLDKFACIQRQAIYQNDVKICDLINNAGYSEIKKDCLAKFE